MEKHRGKPSVTCDECKSRKVRCIKAPNSARPICTNCQKRGIPCRFGFNKKRAKRSSAVSAVDSFGDLAVAGIHDSPETPSSRGAVVERSSILLEHAPSQPSVASLQFSHPEPRLRNLYVDHLLEDQRVPARLQSETSIVKAHPQYIGSSGIAFFSDQRIESICARLGHRRFAELIDGLARAIQSRTSRDAAGLSDSSASIPVTHESAQLYIDSYFKCIHPRYPFLDRKMFEQGIPHDLQGQFACAKPSFVALYYTALALGCQSHSGASFEPRTHAAWQLFQSAMELLPEIITAKEDLLNVQAITAMAIFANNSLRVNLGHMLTSEAARMAQSLGLHRVMKDDNENAVLCHRVFWVVYIIEKTHCFACSRVSIINDSEIAAPPPKTPEAMFGSFDRFQSMCRFSRLSSITYDTLFSVSATLSPYSTIEAALGAFHSRLEDWRLSIPEEAFRPGTTPVHQPLKYLDDSWCRAIAVETHYHYYAFIIALARVQHNIHHANDESSKEVLLDVSRKIIELTNFLDLETYIPIWVAISVPLSALFILFDFVIHNPNHTQTTSNLSLLGIAAGYFCRLEYTSDGVLPTSSLSDVAHFARDFVRRITVGNNIDTASSGSMPQPESSSQQQRSVSSELPSPLHPLSTHPATMREAHIGDIDPNHPPLNYTDDLLFPLENNMSEGIDLMDMFNVDFSFGAMA